MAAIITAIGERRSKAMMFWGQTVSYLGFAFYASTYGPKLLSAYPSALVFDWGWQVHYTIMCAGMAVWGFGKLAISRRRQR